MFTSIYKKLVIDFPKVTLLFLAILIGFSFYHAKNFNLDASSDALLLEGDPDLKYLRKVNETYGSKDFLVLTYTPVSSFIEKETINWDSKYYWRIRPVFENSLTSEWSQTYHFFTGQKRSESTVNIYDENNVWRNGSKVNFG